MRQRCLVLVESNTSGSGRLFARTALRLGLTPVLLAADPTLYGYAQQDRLHVVTADTTNAEALCAVCRRLGADFEIAGVTSSSEYYIESAAALARRLGLPAADPNAIRRCRDKGAQWQRLVEAGVPAPRARRADNPAEAVAAAEQLGWPVVVKPVSGSGSVGVRCCEDADAVRAHSEGLLEQRVNERGMAVPGQVLVQALILGEEFSVESFGMRVIGVTRKHRGAPRFVAVGHDFPACLEPGTAAALGAIAVRALEALELGWGAAHTEFSMTAAGPVLIEVNPRLAGSMIPELIRRAHGIDVIEATILQAIGQEPSLTPTASRFASIGFRTLPHSGRLNAVAGLDRAAAVPGVVDVQLTARLGADLVMRGDFRDKIAHVIAVGGAPQEARMAVERALLEIHFELAAPG